RIDPFKRANMLELVLTDTQPDTTAKAPGAAAPAPAPAPGRALSPAVQKPQLPSTEINTASDQAMEVMKIQRDIAKRRRKRAMLLAARLFVFVLLPTFVAGYYFYKVATPMYATNSEFVIQAADSQGGGGGLGGGLLSGSPLSSSQDSITVQGYLQSRDAMLRLDADEGFRAHFSQDHIDPIQRLDADATQEAAYKKFANSVKIGYDPTEGIIKMEVIAADPATSAQFSKQLIQYAEEQVDQLTARKRGDQMEGADQSRKEAEQKMIDAQVRIVELQEKLGVLSPESEVEAVFGQITQLESELLTERISLQQFLANQRPNEAKVSASENKIAELEKLIDEKRAQLTESNSNSGSLARISGELLVAEADLEVRQGLLAQAEAAFEAASLEANRQVRYLSVAVSPVAPDEPTYPRSFENTILAFFIFAGVYLMVSLTSSILREQV
ncbi:MAG: capsule biosynthesis protein, partial [Litoreibacter sp.]|nr:capsule biosynthesis protein [Litoreibacter sp.]